MLEAWGVLVQGQSMSQRDLFKLEDAASLPPSLCRQRAVYLNEVSTGYTKLVVESGLCMGSMGQGIGDSTTGTALLCFSWET